MEEETENEQSKPVETQSLIPVDPKFLITDEPFKSLFSVDTETYKQTYSKVYLNMDLLGFDETQPIIVWKGRNVVIDGHTRLKVAREKEVKKVWVIEKDFLNEDDAIQYAVHLQRDRRKLTDADILRLVFLLDKRHPPGRPRKTASTEAVSNPSNQVDEAMAWFYYVHEMGGITRCKKVVDGKDLQRFCPDIPYPDDFPKTDLNLALHKRIPSGNQPHPPGRTMTIPGRDGDPLCFKGDLLEGLRQFSEWAYGRSDDITATLIGTSRAKVDKCRYIIRKKNEDIQDKVLRGKLTINRACSNLKNNGKRRNDPKLEFQKGIVVHSKDQSIDSIDLDSVKWVILGTHGKPPKINDPIPKDSIISPKE